MSFSALPPEINSGLMYSGAGSSPLLSAAGAWESLSSELAQAVAQIQSTISSLSSVWTGPSSMAMQTALAPYTTWLSATSAYAGQMGAHAATAASLYEAAHAATVPPPVIAANRALQASLIASNILGQNTPAIAATEAQYMAMWVQDGVAMDTYHATSQANNSQLQAPQPAPQVSNPSSATSSSPSTAASTAGQTVSNVLSHLTSSTSSSDAIGTAGKYLSAATLPVSVGSTGLGLISNIAKAMGTFGSAAGGSIAPGLSGAVRGLTNAVSGPASVIREVTAGMGRAFSVGGLSAPMSWGASAPATLASSVGTALPSTLATAAAEVGGVPTSSALAPLGAAGRAVSQAASVNAKVIGIIPKLMPEYAL